MKKSSFFLSLSVMALVGFGLTACSSSEEEVIDNPNYDPLTKTVNANFVFSVSTGNTTSSTRQTSANTQATVSEVFRGIGEAHLGAFKVGKNGEHVSSSSLSATQNYDLDGIGRGKLDPDGVGLSSAGEGVPLSHHVMELALPIETNALVFWGKATKDGSSTEQGEIDFDASNTDISKHAFSLTPRVPNSSTSAKGKDAFLQYEKIISEVLNVIAKTKVTNRDVTFGTETTHVNALAWTDYVDLTKSPIERKAFDPSDIAGTKPMCSLGIILSDAFAAFHNISAGEIRAGSGSAVAMMIGDLERLIKSVAEAKPNSIQEAVAQQVGIAVEDNISLFFSLTGTTAWLDVDRVVTNCGLDKNKVNLVFTDSNPDLNAFPSNFNVPMGAAQLTFNSTTCEWKYQDEQTHQTIGTGGKASAFDYMYPAELCYFGNSGIRVSDQETTANQYPDGTAKWEKDDSWRGWTKDGSVQPMTHSVAMKDNINYGTALLESTVRYDSNILEDNNHAIQKAKNASLSDKEEPNNQIEVSATSFKLTGIIVGGQARTMGWNYVAKEGQSASFNYLIYDNSLPDGTIPAYTAGGNKSRPNYTLVWDNWSEALKGQDQSTVYVALEFVNETGKAFFGKDNKIPAGATFYIVGKLDPDKKPANMTTITDDAYKADKSLGITWPENYALPPYDVEGNTVRERRVFMQDYMTTANFVLNRESLQKAYVSVPDLRALQISLGMSVDLEWHTGLTFDVVLGE